MLELASSQGLCDAMTFFLSLFVFVLFIDGRGAI